MVVLGNELSKVIFSVGNEALPLLSKSSHCSSQVTILLTMVISKNIAFNLSISGGPGLGKAK